MNLKDLDLRPLVVRIVPVSSVTANRTAASQIGSVETGAAPAPRCAGTSDWLQRRAQQGQ